jgi:predicted nucleotidyltransferase
VLNDLIENIAGILDRLEIAYMIIGGQAVLLYGEPRLTRDIDITLGANVDRFNDLLKLSEELNLTPAAQNVEDFVKRTMVLPLIDKDTELRVDFIFSFTEYEKNAIERAKEFKIKNRPVKFASVEDIIIHKIFSGRPRDLEDIKGILEKNKDLDKDYITKWLKEFDKTCNDNFLKTFNLLIQMPI